jgi:hypothetical protein
MSGYLSPRRYFDAANEFPYDMRIISVNLD